LIGRLVSDAGRIKFEYRISKQTRITKIQTELAIDLARIDHFNCKFVLVSDFDIRISDLKKWSLDFARDDQ